MRGVITKFLEWNPSGSESLVSVSRATSQLVAGASCADLSDIVNSPWGHQNSEGLLVDPAILGQAVFSGELTCNFEGAFAIISDYMLGRDGYQSTPTPPILKLQLGSVTLTTAGEDGTLSPVQYTIWMDAVVESFPYPVDNKIVDIDRMYLKADISGDELPPKFALPSEVQVILPIYVNSSIIPESDPLKWVTFEGDFVTMLDAPWLAESAPTCYTRDIRFTFGGFVVNNEGGITSPANANVVNGGSKNFDNSKTPSNLCNFTLPIGAFLK